NKVLTIGYEHIPPILIVENGKLIAGTDFELVREITKISGCEVEWLPVPFARHLLLLKNGRMDFITSVFHTTERAEYLNYSQPYRIVVKKLFIHSEIEDVQTLSALFKKGHILGLVRGYDYSYVQDELSKAQKNQIIYLKDSQHVLKMLLSNRIQGTVEEEKVFKQLLTSKGKQEKIRAVKKNIHEERMHFAFSKKAVAPEIVHVFNQAISQLRSDKKL
ncbi:MAG: transporter substrate-binding domain-containing protein, partial [Sneathiella sp.]|nr:transporter substrate-binding domain-containing protein [Sneathiella sp.]